MAMTPNPADRLLLLLQEIADRVGEAKAICGDDREGFRAFLRGVATILGHVSGIRGLRLVLPPDGHR